MTNAEARITQSYRHLVQQSRDGWVSLTALRRDLADVDRETLDATLQTMRRSKILSMTLEVNQSRLTKEDRAAALKVGSDNMHFIIFN